MSKPFEEMSSLDRLVHEPARLAILTALAACRGCNFVYLQSLTTITKGNLSNHLQKLEDGGLVSIKKGFRGRVPRTTVQLTQKGRVAIEQHWRHLEELRTAAKAWQSRQRMPDVTES
jgi:DNA-binding MarR family transcriptional regulator